MSIFTLTSKVTLILAVICAIFCLVYRVLTRKNRYVKTRNEEKLDEKS
ncbi:hypothetical protein [Candidatus Enterococcus huntleyi]|nr:hypothetical protein [Enterococcus sp. JM4C]